jgi:hypothetical protein
MINFTITDFPEKKIVGVVKDGNLIGTIYPTKKGIEIVSKHLIGWPESAIEIGQSKSAPTFPAIRINLI